MNRDRDDAPEPREPDDSAAWSEADRDRIDELEHWTPPSIVETWDMTADPPPVPGEEHARPEDAR